MSPRSSRSTVALAPAGHGLVPVQCDHGREILEQVGEATLGEAARTVGDVALEQLSHGRPGWFEQEFPHGGERVGQPAPCIDRAKHTLRASVHVRSASTRSISARTCCRGFSRITASSSPKLAIEHRRCDREKSGSRPSSGRRASSGMRSRSRCSSWRTGRRSLSHEYWELRALEKRWHCAARTTSPS